MTEKTKQISTKDKVAYGLGDMGNGIAMQIVGSYLFFFMTTILHIPSYIAGLAVGVSIVWDAVTDPIMGYISDNTKSRRFGRRHIYLIIGMIGVALTIIGLFFIPIDSSLTLKVSLIFILIILYKTFITILVTPFTALGAELSSDYHERTRIQSIRSVFYMLGIALSMVAGMYIFFQPNAKYPVGQLNPEAYKNMAIVTAIGTVILISIAFRATRKYIPRLNQHLIFKTNDKMSSKIFSTFLNTMKNKAFALIALSYMFNNIATAFVNIIGLHVFTYTFGFSNTEFSIIIGLQFFFSILSQPLWMYLVHEMDKKKCVLLALSITIGISMYFVLLAVFNRQVESQIIYFIPYAIFAGIGTGALFTIPASMVADTIDLEELETGIRTEGVYFGSMTFFYKLAQSITVFIIGGLLTFIGFNSHLSVQSPDTRLYLGLILGFGVAISMLLSYWSISKYTLTKESILSIQAKLQAKALEAPQD